MPPNPQHTNENKLLESPRDVHSVDVLNGGRMIEYGILPGHPESRLPMSEQTDALSHIGIDGVDVMGVIKLGQSEKDEKKGGFNVWLVRSKSGTYALLNGDAVGFFDDGGSKIENPLRFMDDFAEELHPGREVIVGRDSSTLGTEVHSESFSEHGDIDSMSRSHVSIKLGAKDSETGKQEIIIEDLRSTNGTTVERGMKERMLDEKDTDGKSRTPSNLITVDQIPPKQTPEVAEPELSIPEINDRLQAIELRFLEHEKLYKEPKYESLQTLRFRIVRLHEDRKHAQANGQGELSITLQQEIGQTTQKMKADPSYQEYEDLHRENQQLAAEHSKLLEQHRTQLAR